MSTSYLAYEAADDCTIGKSVATNAVGEDDQRKGSLSLSNWSMLHDSNGHFYQAAANACNTKCSIVLSASKADADADACIHHL